MKHDPKHSVSGSTLLTALNRLVAAAAEVVAADDALQRAAGAASRAERGKGKRAASEPVRSEGTTNA